MHSVWTKGQLPWPAVSSALPEVCRDRGHHVGLPEEPAEILVVRRSSGGAYASLVCDAAKADVVGFDAEWLPDHSSGENNPIAVLQLAFPATCRAYVVQLSLLEKVPPEVMLMFVNPDVIKVGFAVDRNDKQKLELSGIRYSTQALVDLQAVCEELLRHTLWGPEPGSLGLARAAQMLLGSSMVKDKRISCSDWTRQVLTQEQIRYAAMDAWVTLRLFYAASAADRSGWRYYGPLPGGGLLSQPSRYQQERRPATPPRAASGAAFSKVSPGSSSDGSAALGAPDERDVPMPKLLRFFGCGDAPGEEEGDPPLAGCVGGSAEADHDGTSAGCDSERAPELTPEQEQPTLAPARGAEAARRLWRRLCVTTMRASTARRLRRRLRSPAATCASWMEAARRPWAWLRSLMPIAAGEEGGAAAAEAAPTPQNPSVPMSSRQLTKKLRALGLRVNSRKEAVRLLWKRLGIGQPESPAAPQQRSRRSSAMWPLAIPVRMAEHMWAHLADAGKGDFNYFSQVAFAALVVFMIFPPAMPALVLLPLHMVLLHSLRVADLLPNDSRAMVSAYFSGCCVRLTAAVAAMIYWTDPEALLGMARMEL